MLNYAKLPHPLYYNTRLAISQYPRWPQALVRRCKKTEKEGSRKLEIELIGPITRRGRATA